jgi:hypothetical protein
MKYKMALRSQELELELSNQTFEEINMCLDSNLENPADCETKVAILLTLKTTQKQGMRRSCVGKSAGKEEVPSLLSYGPGHDSNPENDNMKL